MPPSQWQQAHGFSDTAHNNGVSEWAAQGDSSLSGGKSAAAALLIRPARPVSHAGTPAPPPPTSATGSTGRTCRPTAALSRRCAAAARRRLRACGPPRHGVVPCVLLVGRSETPFGPGGRAAGTVTARACAPSAAWPVRWIPKDRPGHRHSQCSPCKAANTRSCAAVSVHPWRQSNSTGSSRAGLSTSPLRRCQPTAPRPPHSG